jgi:hypothetical protein
VVAKMSVVLLASTDWNEFTAIATGVLAAGVPPTLIVAGLAYRTAKKDLEAASKAAREQIEAEHRPLLIDVPSPGPLDSPRPGSIFPVEFPGGDVMHIDGRRVYGYFGEGRVFFAVPLRNVGRGLAAIEPREVSIKGPGLSAQPLGVSIEHERVPPNEATRLYFTYESVAADAPPLAYAIRVPYKDLDGSQSFEARIHIDNLGNGLWHVRDVKQVRLASAAELAT